MSNYARASLILFFVAAGCSRIEPSSEIVQPLGTPLFAGLGDTIIEIDNAESLPNAFGKADVFGRTRPTGKVVVSYLGLDADAQAVFARRDVRIASSATTLNSTPIIIQQTRTTHYSGNTSIAGNPGGIATTYGTATTTAPVIVPPSGSDSQVIANDQTVFRLDLSKDRRFIVQGRVVTVNEAAETFIAYIIEN